MPRCKLNLPADSLYLRNGAMEVRVAFRDADGKQRPGDDGKSLLIKNGESIDVTNDAALAALQNMVPMLDKVPAFVIDAAAKVSVVFEQALATEIASKDPRATKVDGAAAESVMAEDAAVKP